jgi:hypothetical protein
MDATKIAKWIAWIVGLVTTVLSYITSNPHPDHQTGVTGASQ